ncbi:hypothetical protein D3C72_989510 [compost metagenome]
MIQSLAEAVAARSWVRRGSAVYSTVMSMTMSSSATDTMPSTSQRRAPRPGVSEVESVVVCMESSFGGSLS